jgi:proline iminopeptidase
MFPPKNELNRDRSLNRNEVFLFLHKTLIITGVFDRNTGVLISNLIHSQLSNCEMVLFHKSAHFPDLEEADRFNETVLNFLY